MAADLGQTEAEQSNETDNHQGSVILDTTSLGGVQVIVHDWDAIGNSSDDEFGGKGIRETRTSAAVIGKTPRPPTDLD